ncbi:hypothetical protein MHYP_G00322220 [Metynnis hypsauchen]
MFTVTESNSTPETGQLTEGNVHGELGCCYDSRRAKPANEPREAAGASGSPHQQSPRRGPPLSRALMVRTGGDERWKAERTANEPERWDNLATSVSLQFENTSGNRHYKGSPSPCSLHE